MSFPKAQDVTDLLNLLSLAELHNLIAQLNIQPMPKEEPNRNVDKTV